ncbi:MAG: cyclic nucleotide-binding domain-containing protein [Gammaproteobacteria bacterium]|nr:cyclic nucleotide-binding domain-containing protein [Gammaproteobacteria bacterium]
MDTHHSLDQPLNHLEQEAIQFLMEYGEIRNYKIDDLIVREGEESNYVYILLKGMAHIIKDDAFNNSNIIAKAMPGAIIGEMGVFMELKRTASIVATTEVNALELSNERFMEGLENYPVLMNRLLKNMSSKLNYINQVMVREKQSRQMLFIGMLIMKQLGDNKQENALLEMDFEEPIKSGTLSLLDLTNTFINYQKLHILDQVHFKDDNHICHFMVHPLSLQRFMDHGATAQ